MTIVNHYDWVNGVPKFTNEWFLDIRKMPRVDQIGSIQQQPMHGNIEDISRSKTMYSMVVFIRSTDNQLFVTRRERTENDQNLLTYGVFPTFIKGDLTVATRALLAANSEEYSAFMKEAADFIKSSSKMVREYGIDGSSQNLYINTDTERIWFDYNEMRSTMNHFCSRFMNFGGIRELIDILYMLNDKTVVVKATQLILIKELLYSHIDQHIRRESESTWWNKNNL